MKIARSHLYHVQTKRIEVHYHYIRELHKNFKVKLNSVMLPQKASWPMYSQNISKKLNSANLENPLESIA
jgi:hypothetical protein